MEENEKESNYGRSEEQGSAAADSAQLAPLAAGKGILCGKAVSALVLSQISLDQGAPDRKAALPSLFPCNTAAAAAAG